VDSALGTFHLDKQPENLCSNNCAQKRWARYNHNNLVQSILHLCSWNDWN